MVGDTVILKRFPSRQWKCGKVTQNIRRVSCNVALPNWGIKRRHVDYIKQRHFKLSMEPDNSDRSEYTYTPVTVEEIPTFKALDGESVTDLTLPLSTTSTSSSVPSIASPHRSFRSVQKPAYMYLDGYVTPLCLSNWWSVYVLCTHLWTVKINNIITVKTIETEFV